MTTMEISQQKSYRSEEFNELLFKFLKKWDSSISTLDDIDAQKGIKNRLNRAMSVITSLQKESDEKALKKAKFKSEEGKILLENQNRKWYKEMTRVYYDLMSVMFSIESLYELKNRKAQDVLKLRYEVAKLKNQI